VKQFTVEHLAIVQGANGDQAVLLDRVPEHVLNVSAAIELKPWTAIRRMRAQDSENAVQHVAPTRGLFVAKRRAISVGPLGVVGANPELLSDQPSDHASDHNDGADDVKSTTGCLV
jgi:hypothetical protein